MHYDIENNKEVYPHRVEWLIRMGLHETYKLDGYSDFAVESLQSNINGILAWWKKTDFYNRVRK